MSVSFITNCAGNDDNCPGSEIFLDSTNMSTFPYTPISVAIGSISNPLVNYVNMGEVLKVLKRLCYMYTVEQS